MPTTVMPDTARQVVDEAHAAYMQAAEAFAAAATDALIVTARTQYPDATAIRVTAILEESYAEHDVRAYAGGRNLGPVDLDFTDLMLLTEGVCVIDDDQVTVLL